MLVIGFQRPVNLIDHVREVFNGGEGVEGESGVKEREIELELKLENFILQDCSLGSAKNLPNN